MKTRETLEKLENGNGEVERDKLSAALDDDIMTLTITTALKQANQTKQTSRTSLYFYFTLRPYVA